VPLFCTTTATLPPPVHPISNCSPSPGKSRLRTGLTGLFVTADVFTFCVFFELAMTASYALSAYGGGRRHLRGALVFTAVNLLGSFIFLLSVADAYRVTEPWRWTRSPSACSP
jgi:hypothetical protein